jgi:hypothetical protein
LLVLSETEALPFWWARKVMEKVYINKSTDIERVILHLNLLPDITSLPPEGFWKETRTIQEVVAFSLISLLRSTSSNPVKFKDGLDTTSLLPNIENKFLIFSQGLQNSKHPQTPS